MQAQIMPALKERKDYTDQWIISAYVSVTSASSSVYFHMTVKCEAFTVAAEDVRFIAVSVLTATGYQGLVPPKAGTRLVGRKGPYGSDPGTHWDVHLPMHWHFMGWKAKLKPPPRHRKKNETFLPLGVWAVLS